MNYLEMEKKVAHKDICIWGYGMIGKSYALLALRCAGANVISYCDNKYRPNESFKGIPLVPKEMLFNMEKPFVVIAIKSIEAQEEIQKELKAHNIECIVFDNCALTDLCKSIEQASDLKVNEKYKVLMEDSIYLESIFKMRIGKQLNLENPKTFNEKIQWLKLNDRRSEYIELVDKAAVKKKVAGIIGDEYIIPTYKIYDRFEEIDFDDLPDKFIMKCTHDSGSTVICEDKSLFDVEKARKRINRALATNMYWPAREWPYKNVVPRILIEKYMGNNLIDYKFMCCDGEPRYIFTCTDRNSDKGLKVTWFTPEWEKLEFCRHYPTSTTQIERPEKLGEMIELSRKLSDNKTFVRTDFYEIDGKIWFGELTFYPGAGFEEFDPYEWDEKLGEHITVRA